MSWSWHFILLALYSVLAFYAHNIDELVPRDGVVLGGAALALSLVVFALTRIVVRDARKAGLITAALLLFLLFYGHLFAAAQTWLPRDWVRHREALPLLAGSLIALLFFLFRNESRLRNATIVMNVISGALVIMSAVSIIAHEAAQAIGNRSEISASRELSFQLKPPSHRPHVYFLILDRYAANRTLKARYGFDNAEFETYLRDKGFYIADESVANYIKTAPSLAATFHMDYLDELAAREGKNSSNWRPMYQMLEGEYRVLRAFRAAGYRYVHMGSWWAPTRYHRFADENYNIEGASAASEAVSTYLQGTALPFFYRKALPLLHISAPSGQLADRWDAQCRRIPYQFETLRGIARRSEPTFVFAHLLLPHFPFVFDAEGRCMSPDESGKVSPRDQYVGQVRYASKEVMRMVDALLASENKPIIILQSDEGPFPQHFPGEDVDWSKATEEDFQEKFRILNAVYFPGKPAGQRYPSMSSVNTFRIVFNEYFGADLPLLADRSYAIPDIRHLYDYFEVTDIVR
jgi:hypothetical protein